MRTLSRSFHSPRHIQIVLILHLHLWYLSLISLTRFWWTHSLHFFELWLLELIFKVQTSRDVVLFVNFDDCAKARSIFTIRSLRFVHCWLHWDATIRDHSFVGVSHVIFQWLYFRQRRSRSSVRWLKWRLNKLSCHLRWQSLQTVVVGICELILVIGREKSIGCVSPAEFGSWWTELCVARLAGIATLRGHHWLGSLPCFGLTSCCEACLSFCDVRDRLPSLCR